MDAILDWGLEVISSLRGALGLGVEPLFEGFTILGIEEFYVLVLVPLLFWSVDLRMAARVVVLLLLTTYINIGAKDLLMQPRPCDLDPPICISEAEGYGLPSWHAQSSAVVWSRLAVWVDRGWAWIGAITVIFMIALSRIYLGVHFPTDVLGGWAIALVFLGFYSGLGGRIERWIANLDTPSQIVLSLGAALLLAALHPVKDVISAAAYLAGIGVGLALTTRYVSFSARGPVWQRAVRLLLGLIVVVGLFFGLSSIFPGEGESLYVPLRFLRYGMVGMWFSFGGPWMFRKLSLAPSSSTV